MRKPAAKNILIRGGRSSGKTYLVRRIISEFENRVRIAGFFTKKRKSGVVTIQQWDNFSMFDNGPVAVIIDLNDGCVRKHAFEKTGAEALRRAMEHGSLIIMDELGRFELDCPCFIESVYSAFCSTTPVLATIKDEENPFLTSLAMRKDSLLFTINERTREKVYEEVRSILKTHLLPD
jgi:nucleoside-triphosphatase THEP1